MPHRSQLNMKTVIFTAKLESTTLVQRQLQQENVDVVSTVFTSKIIHNKFFENLVKRALPTNDCNASKWPSFKALLFVSMILHRFRSYTVNLPGKSLFFVSLYLRF